MFYSFFLFFSGGFIHICREMKEALIFFSNQLYKPLVVVQSAIAFFFADKHIFVQKKRIISFILLRLAIMYCAFVTLYKNKMFVKKMLDSVLVIKKNKVPVINERVKKK